MKGQSQDNEDGALWGGGGGSLRTRHFKGRIYGLTGVWSWGEENTEVSSEVWSSTNEKNSSSLRYPERSVNLELLNFPGEKNAWVFNENIHVLLA